jgi:lipopolysaccharide transport system ATP-binding protein
MSDIVVRAEALSKQYRIGSLRAGHMTAREALTEVLVSPLRLARRMWTSDQQKPRRSTIWALKDVSFEVRSGEVVGFAGRNGAGKTTLLKVLSRITRPTTGSVQITGRVGSLLEVGTGFHPELTGRENIYLNGAILGMRRQEIIGKFDEIVAFSEIEKFLDTPVKRYSSGMYVRLAFAVAAHLEPEILIVDEVLAVGDAAFQKKCLGKMGDVAREGRTVLFVSHNMAAISSLCQKAYLLEGGRIVMAGPAPDTVKAYLKSVLPAAGTWNAHAATFLGNLNSSITFTSVHVGDGSNPNVSIISPRQPVTICVEGLCSNEVPAFRTTVSIFREGVRLLSLHDAPRGEPLRTGRFRATFEIPPYFLRPGEYSVAIGGHREGMTEWIWAADVAQFSVLEEWNDQYDPSNIGFVNLPFSGNRSYE